jgi:Formamidopyrimidine-DNA glycosylase
MVQTVSESSGLFVNGRTRLRRSHLPELPEVELFTRYFARHALDQRIAAVRVLDERILEVPRRKLTASLIGHQFSSTQRHGKHLFADAGDDWLHLHFGMTGDLSFYRTGEEPPRFARVIFDFDRDAHLAFDDMRLFGAVGIVSSPEEYIEAHRLGPDPLDPQFRLPQFRRLIAPRRGAVKALLMSQEFVAGVGNLYADEALFETSIDPRRGVETLEPDEVKALFNKIRAILRSTIVRKARGADYPAGSLIQRREVGERCPRCGGTIRRTVVGGRTTYYCAQHQK